MASGIHVHCPAADLYEALALLHPVIPSRATTPVLECIHLRATQDGTLHLTATNLSQRMTVRCPVSLVGTGEALVPAKLLWDTVRSLERDETISLRSEGTTLVLETAYGHYAISGLSPTEFPEDTELPQLAVELPAEVIGQIIHHVRFAASDEPLRPALTGILWEFRPDAFIAVATDGYRLSRLYAPMELNQEGSLLVPAEAAELLRRAEKAIRIGWNSSHVVFEDHRFTLVCQLIGEKFPAYEQVIPAASSRRCIVGRLPLLKALERVSLFSPAQIRVVRLALRTNALELQAEDESRGDRAREVVPCQYDGDDFLIGFNARYLSEVLKAAQQDTLLLEFTEPTRPAVIRWAESADRPVLQSPWVAVVMPVRL